jgi:hypothetical protein
VSIILNHRWVEIELIINKTYEHDEDKISYSNQVQCLILFYQMVELMFSESTQ